MGIDNFITGDMRNIQLVKEKLDSTVWKNFTFVEGNICSTKTNIEITKDVDYILHQAAIGSVPRSIDDPLITIENIHGILS